MIWQIQNINTRAMYIIYKFQSSLLADLCGIGIAIEINSVVENMKLLSIAACQTESAINTTGIYIKKKSFCFIEGSC